MCLVNRRQCLHEIRVHLLIIRIPLIIRVFSSTSYRFKKKTDKYAMTRNDLLNNTPYEEGKKRDVSISLESTRKL